MLFMGLVDLDQPYWLVGEHHFLHVQLNQVGELWERAKKELAPVIPEATDWGKRGGGGSLVVALLVRHTTHLTIGDQM
jgi:hypothetical protein